ncbi:uncharacterized protein LOC109725443 [Ananas comosus]|uniref:Uncharacterized protein LOC109725443 n=1 Tax=Ananas comosus TaxID=4615 RepID=A0A6P5GX18_ANACO|nr:uncharacterized protein LOC109725443 [Ananas comosus]
MKNLYPKGKGRIHPSPSSSSSSSSSSAGAAADAMAVLRLLPAAIVALTAALGDDDKEVLAYLITWSMNGPAPPPSAAASPAERRLFRTPAAAAAAQQQQQQHRALFSCGCFDCYRSFWSRWDCSPDRELIHQAIDAYEDHVAAAQSELHAGGCGGGARATRRRERRSSEKREKAKAKRGIMSSETRSVCDDGEAVIKEAEGEGEEAVAVAVEEGEKLLEAGEEKLLEEASRESEDTREGAKEAVAVEVEVEVEVERRRGWADVTGLFNPRFWGLWRPGV